MSKPPVPEVPRVPKEPPKRVGNRMKGKGKSVPMAELCALIGVAKNTIEKWVKNGLPRHREGNRWLYDVGAVMKWRVDWEKVQLESEVARLSREKNPNPIPMSGVEAKVRKEIAQALTAELDLAIRREQVANIEDLVNEFGVVLSEVRSSLVSMSARLSGILSYKDEEEVGKILDSEVQDILERLSEYERDKRS